MPEHPCGGHISAASLRTAVAAAMAQSPDPPAGNSQQPDGDLGNALGAAVRAVLPNNGAAQKAGGQRQQQSQAPLR